MSYIRKSLRAECLQRAYSYISHHNVQNTYTNALRVHTAHKKGMYDLDSERNILFNIHTYCSEMTDILFLCEVYAHTHKIALHENIY